MPVFSFGLPPPAIIAPEPPRSPVEFGINGHWQRFVLPRDARDATPDELFGWLPDELKGFPRWALAGLLVVPYYQPTNALSVEFLTTTSASNQTHNVRSDWNSASNRVDVVSQGVNGAGIQGGNGGGGGGFARKSNIALTPGGTATYRLRAGDVNGANDADACWYNGTTLAAASVGIRGAGGGGGGTQNGASTTNAKGDIVRAGGNGGNGVWVPNCSCCCPPCENSGAGGGGGGAAGPTGVGGVGADATLGHNAGNGGTGDGGTVAGGVANTSAGGAGTQYTSVPGGVQAGPGGGGAGSRTFPTIYHATASGLYGGGGGGPTEGGGNSTSGSQGLIVVTNNPVS